MRQTLVADRYRLLRLVGSGGMGQVWLAQDELLHREVAVKEILPPRWMDDSERDELQARTMREARTAARLTHPNVVRIYDVVDDLGSPWIVMEYVPSRSLQELLEAEGPVGPHRAAELGLAVLGALRAAHRAGVVHRDVKPHNVLIADDGRVMLTDFGLATFDDEGVLTRPGMVLGSPQYVAPERLADGVSSMEGDLWSLGASLYTAVEGRSPYARSTAVSTLAALATAPPDPVSKAGPLAPVLAGLLRRDPRQRLDAAEAERLLTQIASAPPAAEPSVPASVPVPAPVSASASTPALALASASAERDAADERHGSGPGGSGPGAADEAARHAETGPHRRGAGSRFLVPAGAVLLMLVTAALIVVVTREAVPGDATAGSAPGTQQPPGPSGRPPHGPGGPPPVGPPPFGCRPPPPPAPMGRVEAGSAPPGRRPIPANWTWHTDAAGFRLPAPIGWEYFPGNEVLCFHEPYGPRAIIVDPSPASGDDAEYWRGREEQLTHDDRVTGYELVDTRKLPRYPGTEWEFRWTGPNGQKLRTSEMLVHPAPDRSFAVVWHTADSDWQSNLDHLTVLREGFEAVKDQRSTGERPAPGPRGQPGGATPGEAGTPSPTASDDPVPQESDSPAPVVPPGHGGIPPGHGGTPPGQVGRSAARRKARGARDRAPRREGTAGCARQPGRPLDQRLVEECDQDCLPRTRLASRPPG